MIQGIDVSKWNGTIGWEVVAASGIKFAMIRAGYGSATGGFNLDPTFRTNILGASEAGVKVGVYIYSYAKFVEAAEIEADKLLTVIEPYRKLIEYPVVYDIEEKSQAQLGKNICTGMCNAFCDKVRAAGYTPMVYANQGWLKDYLYADQIRGDIWLALWKNKDTYPGAHTMWQYTADGKVPGIEGVVDMDFTYVDYAEKKEEEIPDYAKDAVNWAVKNGILKGDGQGHYGLNDPVILVRLITFLYRTYCLLAADDGK